MRKLCSMLVGVSIFLSASANAALYELKEVVSLKPQPQAKLVELWIPVPYEGKWQKIEKMEIESPYLFQLLKEPEYGDEFIYIKHEGKLEKPVKITVKLLVERKEVKPGKLNFKPPLRYLLPDRLIPVDRFKSIAEKITAGKKTEVEKLKAIYDYVISRLKYDKSGKGWGRGDAVWAFNEKRGNCVDFHSLFIALCRAVDIPVRFQIGLPINGDGEVKGYHCWLLAYPDGFVYGIDASEADKHPSLKKYYFGHLKDNRIGITIGRDILLAPAQHGDRLNFMYKPYEEVDLKPSKAIEIHYYVKRVK